MVAALPFFWDVVYCNNCVHKDKLSKDDPCNSCFGDGSIYPPDNYVEQKQ